MANSLFIVMVSHTMFIPIIQFPLKIGRCFILLFLEVYTNQTSANYWIYLQHSISAQFNICKYPKSGHVTKDPLYGISTAKWDDTSAFFMIFTQPDVKIKQTGTNTY